VKYLHGLPTISGRGWVFEGISGDSYAVEYQRKVDCYSHDILDEVISLDAKVSTLTVAELVRKAREVLGPEATIEFPREMIEKFVCPSCATEEAVFRSASKVHASRALCPSCADVRREVVTFFRVTGGEAFVDRTLAEIGVPPYDIIFGINGDRLVGFELSGDARFVLGGLIGDEGEVAWL
jgi:adenylyltransferase/sulfurtransferase